MKKKTLHSILAILMMIGCLNLQGQCPDDNSEWLTVTLSSPQGVTQEISTCTYGGEFNLINVTPEITYRFSTCGDTDFDTELTVYDVTTGNMLGHNNDACGLQSEVDITVPVGTTQLRVLIDQVGCTDISACMTMTGTRLSPDNDLCTEAISLPGDGTYTGSTIMASENLPLGGGVCIGDSDSEDDGVWYTFVGDGSDWLLEFPAAAGWDPEVNVYTGACGAYVCETGDDDAGPGLSAEVTVNSVNGTQYWVYVHDCCGGNADFTFDVTVSCSDPVLNSFTITPSVCPGEPTLVSYTGTPNAIVNINIPGVGNYNSPLDASGNYGFTFVAALGNYTGTVISITDGACVTDLSGVAPIDFVVEDLVAPTITCGGDQTVTTSGDGATGDCFYSDFLGIYTIGDNCANGGTLSVSEVFTDENGIIFKNATYSLPADTWSPYADWPTGVNTAVITVTDGSGLTASCSYQVTVIDDEAPVFDCPADIAVNTDPGVCGAIVNYDISVSDNCAAPSSLSGFTLIGTHDGSTYFLSDALVNVSEASANAMALGGHLATITSAAENTFLVNNAGPYRLIGLNDVENEGDFVWETGEPVTFTNWFGGEPNNLGNEDYVVINFGNGWNDIPSYVSAAYILEFDALPIEAEMTAGLASGELFPVGTTTITYSATDEAGNTTNCTFDVTVTDDQAPIINCPSDIVVNTDPGECGAIVEYSVSASDNCPLSGPNLLVNGDASQAGMSGWNVIQSSGSGWLNNGSGFITSYSGCDDGYVSNRRGQLIDLVALGYTPSELDAMPEIFFQETFRTFSTNAFCGPANSLDTYYMRVEALDANGSVLDSWNSGTPNNPMRAPNAGVTESGSLSGYGTGLRYVYFEDGGEDVGFWNNHYGTFLSNASVSLGIPPVLTNGLASGSVFPVGESTVSYSATDESGNTSMCSFTVTVIDNEAPHIVCTPHVSKKATEGLCGDYISLIDPIVVSENCGLASITSDAPADQYYEVGTHIVTFYVEDVNGNISTCETEVKVTDLEEPVLDCENVIQVYLQPNQCSVFVPMPEPEVTDNCGVASVVNDSPGTFTAGNTFVMWQATDIHGNVSYCETEVRVKDVTDPVITSCPNDITVDAHPNLNDGAYVDFAATATDNCGSTYIHYSQNPNTIFPVGTTTVYVDATDTQGNHDYCEFTVTVLPLFSVECPDDIVTTVADDLNGAFVSWNEPALMLIDDCDCAEEEINGFDHIGDFGNSQYYLYNVEKVEWADALLKAQLAGGHLVTIGSATENQWVSDAIAPYNLEEGAWMGLNDLETETVNEWITGEPLVYENFHAGMPDDTFLEDVYLFQNDGEWEDKPVGFPFYFIMEINCVNIDQTNDLNANNGGFFPIGTTTITYSVSDNCGNSDECSFDIIVESNEMMPLVDPCQIAGAEGLHIESFKAGDYENISGDNGGYADFVGEPIQIGETTEIQLTPGGTFADGKAFWTVWMDTNNDGDFYDNELLYQAEAEGVHNATFEMPTNPDLTSMTHMMRIAVSNEHFIAPCGDFGAGEVEDYRVAITSEIVSNGCYLEFLGFEGSKEFTGNELSWVSQSDCKVDYYKVQHSLDGVDFEDIKKIDANNGVDVSTYYGWTHDDAYNGINYYRIAAKTVEMEVFHTQVIEIKSVELGKITIFPNPANDKANIDLSAYEGKAAQLSIFNILGQQMWTSQYEALPSAPINLDLRDYYDQTMYVTIQIEGHRLISLPLVVDRINFGGARY